MEVGEIRPGGAKRSDSARLRGVEGLRAVAAATVLLHHVYLFGGAQGAPLISLPGPGQAIADNMRFGLTLFFVLSGFLLFRPYAAAILRGTEPPRPGAFLRNRALRIVPAYWVILLVVAFPMGAAVLDLMYTTGPLTDPATLTANLLLLQGFSGETAFTGIGPAWTLAVEVGFYLSLPPLAALAFAVARRTPSLRGRRLAVLVPVGLLLLVGLTSRVILSPGSMDLLAWRLAFPAYADLFAVGMLAAVMHEGARSRVPSAGVCIAGAGTIALGIQVLGAAGERGGGWDLAAAVASGLVLLAVCSSAPDARSHLAGALEWRPVFWVGLCSYSVYLWHSPVIFFLRDHGVVSQGPASLVGLVVVVAVVTLALSAVTYRWVERPALARKRLRPVPDGSLARTA